jgi:dTDP-4-dehydrorhamnose 3,5-epimerase
MIDGVTTKKLRVFPDERGWLMEILRRDDPIFEEFGQVYVTAAYQGVVKAWHMHELQTDHFCVLSGMAKIVLYDGREDSPTRGEVNEFFLGTHDRSVLKIPKLVMHGFKCISQSEALILNVPTEMYNPSKPDEIRRPADDPSIPYDWSRKDG